MKDGSQISGGDSTGEFFIIGLADERGFYAVGSLHNNHYYSVQMQLQMYVYYVAL